MLLISTGLFQNQTAIQAIQHLSSEGIRAIELSAGRYSADLIDDLKKVSQDFTLFVHNYFPPAEEPFVFNLASFEAKTVQKSLDHAKTAIRLSVELGNPVYSFHAGYLLALQPTDLGKQLNRKKLEDREVCLTVFIERVCSLAEFARKEGVELLIENNVLSQANYEAYQANPFLVVTADEAEYVMKNTPDNVNLLMDVAHLKVSAHSLGFDAEQMLHRCHPWIRAYHLSDNDGISDSNDNITVDSWFWTLLKRDYLFCTLEIRDTSIINLIDQYNLVIFNLGCV
ncbi:sugar phosphate isomerase/epimerase [bacterium]|nr:sugar phosphate isomerase/epimerase [bacterium]